MTVTSDVLATTIARVLDARMGILDIDNTEPTLADIELADSLLARFEIREK